MFSRNERTVCLLFFIAINWLVEPVERNTVTKRAVLLILVEKATSKPLERIQPAFVDATKQCAHFGH
jgi:hypothetical protein